MRTTNKERIEGRVLGATPTMTLMTRTTKNKEVGATTTTNKERLTQMYNPSSDFMKKVTMLRNLYLRQQMTADSIPDVNDLRLQGRWIVNPRAYMYPSPTHTSSPTTSPSSSTTHRFADPTEYPSASPNN